MANISQKWLDIGKEDLKVFEIFTRSYNFEGHGSEIAKVLKMPQRSIARKLDKLCSIGVLKFRRVGKNKEYLTNKENPLIIQFFIFAEVYKCLNFLVNHPKIAFALEKIDCGMVIFGSYAKGENRQDSDLDIVFLCQESSKIKSAIQKLPIEVHAHYSTIKEFANQLKAKDTLAIEIAKNHIIINKYDEVTRIFLEAYNG